MLIIHQYTSGQVSSSSPFITLDRLQPTARMAFFKMRFRIVDAGKELPTEILAAFAVRKGTIVNCMYASSVHFQLFYGRKLCQTFGTSAMMREDMNILEVFANSRLVIVISKAR